MRNEINKGIESATLAIATFYSLMLGGIGCYAFASAKRMLPDVSQIRKNGDALSIEYLGNIFAGAGSLAPSTTMLAVGTALVACSAVSATLAVDSTARLIKASRESSDNDQQRTKPNGHLRRPPILDYDVITGLPNHRATPERAVEIMTELEVEGQTKTGSANSAPWCGAQVGCWDRADNLRLQG